MLSHINFKVPVLTYFIFMQLIFSQYTITTEELNLQTYSNRILAFI
jgi:hypothetical protein